MPFQAGSTAPEPAEDLAYTAADPRAQRPPLVGHQPAVEGRRAHDRPGPRPPQGEHLAAASAVPVEGGRDGRACVETAYCRHSWTVRSFSGPESTALSPGAVSHSGPKPLPCTPAVSSQASQSPNRAACAGVSVGAGHGGSRRTCPAPAALNRSRARRCRGWHRRAGAALHARPARRAYRACAAADAR